MYLRDCYLEVIVNTCLNVLTFLDHHLELYMECPQVLHHLTRNISYPLIDSLEWWWVDGSLWTNIEHFIHTQFLLKLKNSALILYYKTKIHGKLCSIQLIVPKCKLKVLLIFPPNVFVIISIKRFYSIRNIVILK